uniref:Uncharacterized protein n=1 Tax=Onchocerca volvulus TaxID=6282 RepID=A0A8R1XPK8_ONCVO
MSSPFRYFTGVRKIIFAGYTSTPKQCVADWVRLATEHGCPFDLFHQQLMFMLRSSLNSRQRIMFNGLSNHPAVFDYLSRNIFKNDIFE